jgi:putative ABC transport system ATP-binding protein
LGFAGVPGAPGPAPGRVASVGALIRLQGVVKEFPMGGTVYPALRGVDLEVEEGEFVAITGPSGHGKSTLMSILGLLDRPTRGTYLLAGEDVSSLSEDAMAYMRRRTMGFVFQSFHLVPTLTALENVELPMVYARVPAARRRERALELLDWAGLGDHVHHRPSQLSGGQQQRVAVCRALAMDPLVILADEPTGNLDSEAGQQILGQLLELSRQGRTLVVVTHEPEVASLAPREVHMLDGRVQWQRRGDAQPSSPGVDGGGEANA